MHGRKATMNNEHQSSNIDSKQDPNDWEHNHGIGFLSMVLWELGHPEEPDKTLLAVLKDVQQETGACILSFDDAAVIIGQQHEFDHYRFQGRRRARQSRIKAREERQQKETMTNKFRMSPL